MIEREKIERILKEILDPEIPISIYDLGLVERIDIEGRKVRIELVPTSPFCPLAYVLPRIVEQRIKQELPDIDVEVVVRLDIVWTPQRMTAEGRKKFRELFGYDPAERFS